MNRLFITLAASATLTAYAQGQGFDLSNPRIEAEYLAVESTRVLTPPAELADQIQADLAEIRSTHPEVSSIRVYPDWMPGEVLVGLTDDALSMYRAGSFHAFDNVFAAHGTPQTRLLGSPTRPLPVVHMQFNRVYHGELLADLFDDIEGVRYSEPNYAIGDGNDIEILGDRLYDLSKGFGDCPAGCIYRQHWRFGVNHDGQLALIQIPEPSTQASLIAALSLSVFAFPPRRRLC
ncbi:MAG: hypothetical protein IT424_10150 [Pirellulales bacterium]|nr:hypothetical protein [Pirellulales bacterium]